ncbi:hypothetical protein K466DRAFT_592096 [Polyporus arcularius HHB13444]|uniref:Uncharacterized protein n=1 Tax=Polyporus arcularius HHB13444 TaxID=1314778 RepID=A0A5C3P2K5_9APHY|nr:hypothetical protein K466DRAFT_592096 [Polyporus arcularius HHB13444]
MSSRTAFGAGSLPSHILAASSLSPRATYDRFVSTLTTDVMPLDTHQTEYTFLVVLSSTCSPTLHLSTFLRYRR